MDQGTNETRYDWSDDDRSTARILRSRAKPRDGGDYAVGPDETVLTLSEVAKSLVINCDVPRPGETFISYEYEPRPGNGH